MRYGIRSIPLLDQYNYPFDASTLLVQIQRVADDLSIKGSNTDLSNLDAQDDATSAFGRLASEGAQSIASLQPVPPPRRASRISSASASPMTGLFNRSRRKSSAARSDSNTEREDNGTANAISPSTDSVFESEGEASQPDKVSTPASADPLLSATPTTAATGAQNPSVVAISDPEQD